METFATDPHDLLPWYVTGTLDSQEAAEYERHREGCRSCGEEETLLRELRDAIGTYGEAFFLPHPEPELIVGWGLGELPGPQVEAVRRHLAFCSTCTTEARMVAGGGGELSPRAPRRSSAWKPALLWVGAAALVLALVFTVRPRSLNGPSRTSLPQTYYVEGPERSTSPSVVEIPSTGATFQIVLPVGLPASTYPLSVEIRDGRGRTVFSQPDVRTVYRESFLFVLCDGRDFPAGEYLAEVRPRSSSARALFSPLEYRFRVTEAHLDQRK